MFERSHGKIFSPGSANHVVRTPNRSSRAFGDRDQKGGGRRFAGHRTTFDNFPFGEDLICLLEILVMESFLHHFTPLLLSQPITPFGGYACQRGGGSFGMGVLIDAVFHHENFRSGEFGDGVAQQCPQTMALSNPRACASKRTSEREFWVRGNPALHRPPHSLNVGFVFFFLADEGRQSDRNIRLGGHGCLVNGEAPRVDSGYGLDPRSCPLRPIHGANVKAAASLASVGFLALRQSDPFPALDTVWFQEDLLCRSLTSSQWRSNRSSALHRISRLRTPRRPSRPHGAWAHDADITPPCPISFE